MAREVKIYDIIDFMSDTKVLDYGKNASVKNLLWMDLEMTGLEPTRDRIIDVAVIATTFDFSESDRYETGVLQEETEIRALLDANDFAKSRPIETEAEVQRSLRGRNEKEVEQDIMNLIARNFGNEPVYLAGNSIHADRGFVRQWWPSLNARLHYRMLDVSSFKLLWLGRGGETFVKQEKHTALADIEESIAELKFYLKNMQIVVPD